MRKTITLTRQWLERTSDEDVLWCFTWAESRGWTVLVK